MDYPGLMAEVVRVQSAGTMVRVELRTETASNTHYRVITAAICHDEVGSGSSLRVLAPLTLWLSDVEQGIAAHNINASGGFWR